MKAMLLSLALLGTFSTSLQAQVPVQGEDHGGLPAGPFSEFDLPNDTSKVLEALSTGMTATSLPLRVATETRIRQSRTPLQGATRGGTVGLLIGGGIGVIAGLKVGSGECRQPPGVGCIVHGVVKAVAPVFGGIVGAGAGAFIGGLVGSVHPGERWVRVTVPM